MTVASQLLETTGNHLILPLNRPQYTVPEAFATCLAWSQFEVELAEASDSGKVVAVTYKSEERSTKTLVYRRTYPVGQDDRLGHFADALRTHGLEAENDQLGLAEAVANSILGVETRKGKSQSAAPLTVGTALLQNFVGIVGSANPPDLGQIIEGLYSLGDTAPDPSRSAASLWRRAVECRTSIDPVLFAVDKSVRASLLESEPTSKEELNRDKDSELGWSGLLEKTPFEWFFRAWNALTQDEWVKALPPRVWVDWASTIMRLALGMGFLWEAAFNEEIARSVLRAHADSSMELNWFRIRNSMPELLPWRSRHAQTSVRDVSSILIRRVKRSELVRSRMSTWLVDHEAGEQPLSEVLTNMAKSQELVADLTAILGSVPQKNSNLWEAIRYSLMVRDDSGPHADYYGMLRSRGTRYLLPDPGTEWISVVASLCCPTPSSQTNLGEVMLSLRSLGLRPELSDVVSLLEQAGLARGSADADQGVIVESAF